MTKDEMQVTDLPGVGPSIAEKLEIAGYKDLMNLATVTPAEIVAASGVTEATAKKIIAAARSNLKMDFETGDSIMKRREKIDKISTHSKAFDVMMGGGFETGAITECYGEFGSGKTQLAHLLAVNCQKDNPNVVVIFIDTENTFRPKRIKQFAEGAKLDPEKVLKNIKVARAYNSDHQILLAEKVDNLIKEKKWNVKLVVIDSLTAHFRADFVGRGTLADRQQKLNRHMHVLSKIADVHNLCVYVTNQVMADPAQFFGDPTKSVGGHIVGHNSVFRVYLRKGKKGSRVAKLVDSPDMPDSECNFFIEEKGLKDI